MADRHGGVRSIKPGRLPGFGWVPILALVLGAGLATGMPLLPFLLGDMSWTLWLLLPTVVAALYVGVVVTVVVRLRRVARKRQALRLHGLAGTAELVGVRQAHITMGEDPVMHLEWRSRVPGRPVYTVSERRTVGPAELISGLRLGAVCACRVHPDCPDEFVLT